MTGYIIRRLLWMIPVVFSVALITFVLMHQVPGGPFDQEVSRSPQVAENLNRKYGLDQPLWQQFGRYMINLLHGDLGISFQFQNRPVTDIIAQGVKVTATLGLFAFLFGVTLGITLGILAALNRNGPIDYASVLFATAGASMPSFVFAIILVTLLSVKLHWLPVTGWGSWKHMIMPVVALGLRESAFLARITRASMLDVLQQDFIRTARAKGLREFVVVFRHIIKNALIPVLTVLGPLSAGIVVGSFIIEQFFAIPGVGRSFVTAVFARDYGMIMGTTLFYAFVVAFANLIVDILYGVVDPRIRYS